MTSLKVGACCCFKRLKIFALFRSLYLHLLMFKYFVFCLFNFGSKLHTKALEFKFILLFCSCILLCLSFVLFHLEALVMVWSFFVDSLNVYVHWIPKLCYNFVFIFSYVDICIMFFDCLIVLELHKHIFCEWIGFCVSTITYMMIFLCFKNPLCLSWNSCWILRIIIFSSFIYFYNLFLSLEAFTNWNSSEHFILKSFSKFIVSQWGPNCSTFVFESLFWNQILIFPLHLKSKGKKMKMN